MGLDDIAGYDAVKGLPQTHFTAAAQPDSVVNNTPEVERAAKSAPVAETTASVEPGGPPQMEVQAVDAATIARMSAQGNGMPDVLGNGGKVAPSNPMGGTPVNKHAAYSPPQPGGGRGRA
jgi:hypothetical protein